MAQQIKLRRGPVDNLPSVVTAKGELLLATGSLGTLAGPFLTMTGTAGTGASTIVGKIYEGNTAPNISAPSYSSLTGTPFYSTTNKRLVRLNHAGNEFLDLTGNIVGNTIDNVTINTLNSNIKVNGYISSSGNLEVDGSGTIDGTLFVNGNIASSGSLLLPTDGSTIEFASVTIEDASGVLSISGATTVNLDTLSTGTSNNVVVQTAGGNLVTDEIDDKVWGGNLVDGSGGAKQITYWSDTDTITGDSNLIWSAGSGVLTVSGSVTVNGNIESTAGRLQASDIGYVNGTTTFTGSFNGDGSGLTGLATDLDFAGESGAGTVSLLSQTFTITGGEGIDTSASNQTLTISGEDASTSNKGIASFNSTNFSVTNGAVSSNDLTVTAGSGLNGGGSFTLGESTTLSVNSGSMLPYFSSSIFSTVSGDITIASDGTAAISSDAVALGTNTTGNYVATLTAGTGITSTGATTGEGINHSLSVDYGSTSGTAVQGNTPLTIQGTTNEIEVSGGSITLGNGGTVTVGLPNNVTIGNKLTVNGDLEVKGTSTIVDSTTVSIGDNIIELNGTGAANGGLLIKDVTAPSSVSGSLLWDSTNDYWKGGPLGSEKEIALLGTDPTTNYVQKIDSNGHLVDSNIVDNGTTITFAGEINLQEYAADSFLATNSTNGLLDITPSTNGDILQYNGTTFVASNVIDGGTF